MKVDIKSQKDLIELLNKQPGYFIGEMSDFELQVIKNLVEDQYYTRILSEYPKCATEIFSVPMSQYHLKSQLIEHQGLWPKRSRILGPNAVESIKALVFFQILTDKLGVEGITGEENSGWQEIYWRIVRPGTSDIGNLHADKWFWDLGHGDLASHKRRIKIWIALETTAGQNGLRVVPNSHLNDEISYHGEIDHTGVMKPKLDMLENLLNIKSLVTKPGEFVVFHDQLLHGGMENISKNTRVSIEATLIINK